MEQNLKWSKKGDELGRINPCYDGDSKVVVTVQFVDEKVDSSSKSKNPQWRRRYLGITLAIVGGMIYELTVLIVKTLPQYHPYSVTFWRFQGILWPAIPIIIYQKGVKKANVFGKIWPLTDAANRKTLFFVFLRGLSGASKIVLQFYSLVFISMADSCVIASSTAVFVSLASHFLLGEKSGIIPILCGVTTLVGVGIIARPPILTGKDAFDSDTLIGTGLSLGCMLCAGSTFLLLRYLRQVHFSTITLYFGLHGSVQSLIMSLAFSTFQFPVTGHDWLMAGALAGLTFLSQSCMTLSCKYEQAGIVALCRTLDALFAFLWQFIFLGVVPDIYSGVGGVVVMVGVVVATIRKFVSDLPEDSKTKQRWRILLK